MSARPTPTDTARTLLRVLEKMMAGGASVVPPFNSDLRTCRSPQYAGCRPLRSVIAPQFVGCSGWAMIGIRKVTRRSLIGEILTIQFAITGGITLIALAGLVWTSGLVIRDNLGTWAEQWASELNELGAPFYIRDKGEAVLDVERFVKKYPEIRTVTWYKPDGTVFTSLDKDGPVGANATPLAATVIEELSTKVGQNQPYLLRQNVEGNRRFRLSGPVWVDSFGGDGVFETNRQNAKSTPKLLGFVAVDLDFSAYQSAFLQRLAPACAALIALVFASGLVARRLVKRALQPLSELQQPLADMADGKMTWPFRSRDTRRPTPS